MCSLSTPHIWLSGVHQPPWPPLAHNLSKLNATQLVHLQTVPREYLYMLMLHAIHFFGKTCCHQQTVGSPGWPVYTPFWFHGLLGTFVSNYSMEP